VIESKPDEARNVAAGEHLLGEASTAAVRLRITFAKTESMRYTGHLDLHRTWERTIRRARLPLAYSQGFNRRPRLQLALALPLGFTSECELLDAWFYNDLDLNQARLALDRAIPPGLGVLAIAEAGLMEPPLQTRIRSASYITILLDHVPDLDSRVARLLAAGSLPRVRRGKSYDLRPMIEALTLAEPGIEDRAQLSMQLSAREGQTGRPDEVLSALEIPPESARVHRVRLILDGRSAQETTSTREQR
jgi:radical SAM-linked protein